MAALESDELNGYFNTQNGTPKKINGTSLEEVLTNFLLENIEKDTKQTAELLFMRDQTRGYVKAVFYPGIGLDSYVLAGKDPDAKKDDLKKYYRCLVITHIVIAGSNREKGQIHTAVRDIFKNT